MGSHKFITPDMVMIGEFSCFFFLGSAGPWLRQHFLVFFLSMEKVVK